MVQVGKKVYGPGPNVSNAKKMFLIRKHILWVNLSDVPLRTFVRSNGNRDKLLKTSVVVTFVSITGLHYRAPCHQALAYDNFNRQ